METTQRTILFYSSRAPKALLRMYDQAEKVCVDRITRGMLSGCQGQPIVFALPNAQLANAAALCRKSGCKDVRIHVLDNGFKPVPIRIDVSKPRLNYMETEIARVCNLHCRGCADFIQFAADEKPFYNLTAFQSDLKQLKTKFWGVEKIRLLGGEPLLAKNIGAYAEHTRRIFPDADIRIVTNGLLIPSVSEETLARIRKCGCSFDISNYPPTAKRRKEIVSALRKSGVSYDFGPPMRFFFKNVSEKPSGDQKSAFDNCMFPDCHMMNQGGILTPCSFAYCIRRFNRHYGTDYLETDCVDLYKTPLDGWQILHWLSNPHPFCGCCTSGMVPILWRDGVHKNDAMKGDWLIPKNVWTDHVIPFAQRLVIPSAKALRSFVQRNKSGS